MNDLDETAAWVRETRRSAFWRGFVIGAAAMLLAMTLAGCATPQRTAALVGFVAVSVAISADGGKHHAPPLALTPPQKLPCTTQRDGSCR